MGKEVGLLVTTGLIHFTYRGTSPDTFYKVSKTFRQRLNAMVVWLLLLVAAERPTRGRFFVLFLSYGQKTDPRHLLPTKVTALPRLLRLAGGSQGLQGAAGKILFCHKFANYDTLE